MASKAQNCILSSVLRQAAALVLLLCSLSVSSVCAQKATVQYFYDDSGRVSKAVDSLGNKIDYTYDAAGNITQVTRGTAPAANQLAIENFTPQSGPVGAVVTIQGQNFSTIPASNLVKFNGAAATVLSATSTTLAVSVPVAATTGPVSVTVGSNTATTTDNFTFIPIPAILSVSPQYLVSSSTAITVPNFQITGASLTGASFSFSPAYNPPPVTINSATIAGSGNSAALSLTIAPGTLGSFTLVGTNAAGPSSQVAGPGNTLQVINADGDADGDGLTNAVEVVIGTSPVNPQTSGVGLSDGWQVFYGLNPLSASSAGPDPGNSGDTALQDFQQGLSPRNPNRVPPAVTKITPANGATNVYINSAIVVRFGEPLLIGTSLAAAQNAIAAALGANSSVPASSLGIAATTLQSYMNRTCCGNSVVPGVVTVTGPYGPITGGVAASSDGLSVTFAPTVPLTSNSTYTVQVNGVRDSAGNLMTKAFTSSFTTGATVDNSIPTIKLVDPENGSTGVPTNVHYTVQFSKTMDPSTLTPANFSIIDQTTNQAVPGTVQVDPSGLTAAFVPSPSLPIGRSFTVNFSAAIKDTVGNNLASASSYYFSTGFADETAAPHLVANSPISGSSGIPVNAVIDLGFSQPLDIASVVPNIQVSAGGQPIQVMVALSGGDERVTLTPVSGLQANVQYTVAVGAGISNIAGILLDNPGTFTFQTAGLVDQSRLSVVTMDPGSNATGVPINALMRVGFNKQVDVVSLGGGDVQVYPESTGVPIAGTITASADGLSATFTPSSSLLPETHYCFYVSGLVDLEGQPQSGYASNCFTTGATAQTTAPAVVAVSPGNGATGVPVNAAVEVELSVPVSVGSVGASAIAVTSGSQAVAGTVTASGSTVTFTPSSSLAVSTAYKVTASGFTDLAGNAVTAFTSGFTTSSSPTADAGPLQVTGITPVSGTTGVPVKTAVVVTFNEAVNPVTVTTSSVNVEANGATVAGSYAVSGSTVTFTPLTPLPGSATIQVYVDGYGSVEDLAGNNGQGAVSSFTTAATADTTAPTVISVTPANKATGIGLNGQVVITFSKSMNPATLNGSTGNIALLVEGQRQSFSPSVSADNRTVVLGSLNLPASSVVTVALPDTVTDLSGNALVPYTSEFTTGPGFETGHASVVTQRPGNGATGVGLNASPVVLYVNRPLNAGTVPGAVHVSANGQLVTGTVTVVGDGQTIEFTPSAPWPYGALVQVFLDATAEDTGGNTVTAYQGTFNTVGDPAATAPAVVNYSPGYYVHNVPLNAVMDAGYSEPLDPTTVNTTNVYLSGPNGTVTATVGLDATGTVVHLTPGSTLAANAGYCFYVQNVQGMNGKAAQNLGYCFYTGGATQTTAPTVVAVSPADKLGSVPLNANISVLFSEPIDPLTVSGATIQVSGGGQTSMPASISFTNNNQTVEITPEAPLPPATAMTLTVSGVTDVAGNAVTAHTTHFTTGTGIATTNPGIVAANPPASATGVPVNAAISLQANTAIDPTTVNSASFQVYDNTLNQYVSGAYSESANGMTVYFVPAAQLATGRQYTVYFTNQGMTDLAGNPLSGSPLYNFNFTTGFSASTAGPQVTGVSPSNGLKQVPINAQITVEFNEPVDEESLSGVTLTAGGTAIPVTASLSNGNQLLTVIPVPGLTASTAYTLTIAGVTDLSGNPISSPYSSTFTTGTQADFTVPSVVSVLPSSGSSGVASNTAIKVTFNKFMNVLSINGLSFTLSTNGTAFAAGTVTVSQDGTVATLLPSNSLRTSTTYLIQLTNAVTDLEGEPISAFQSAFTTGTK